MEKNNKFTRNQLIALCTMVLLAPALRLFPSGTIDLAHGAAWLSAPAALLPCLIYIWFLSMFMDCRNEGEGLAELTLRALGRRTGVAALLIFSVWLIVYAGFILRSGANRFIVTVFPNSPPAFFSVIMGAAAFIAALGSFKALGRAAKVALPLVITALILIIIFSVPSVDRENLLPVTSGDILPITKSTLPAIDVISCVAYIICFCEGSTPREPGRFKAFALWLCPVAFFMSLIIIGIVGSFGAELAGVLSQPFFSMVKNLVFFRSVERIEAMVVMIWVFPDFMLVSLLFFSAQLCLRRAFGLDAEYRAQRPSDMSRGRWFIWLCAAAAVVCSLFIGPDAQSLLFWSIKLIPALNLFFAFLYIPLIYIIGRAKNRL